MLEKNNQPLLPPLSLYSLSEVRITVLQTVVSMKSVLSDVMCLSVCVGGERDENEKSHRSLVCVCVRECDKNIRYRCESMPSPIHTYAPTGGTSHTVSNVRLIRRKTAAAALVPRPTSALILCFPCPITSSPLSTPIPLFKW